MRAPGALTVEHESRAAWQLAPGEAMHLRIGPGPRRLEVVEGRVWLTRMPTGVAPEEDVWLEAGDAVELPSGTDILVDGHPHGSFRLLVPPQPCPLGRKAQFGAWLARLGGARSPLRPA